MVILATNLLKKLDFFTGKHGDLLSARIGKWRRMGLWHDIAFVVSPVAMEDHGSIVYRLWYPTRN
jgi:hypothetical protein